MRRRHFLPSLLASGPLAAAASPRPNIVFILVDDLRFDELACTGHPFAQTPAADRLAREGANFRNAFATTPLCSPSRAAFLTGSYSHSNGILDNVARDRLSHQLVTWPRLLHDTGYRTAFLGKWHMGNDDSPRPGFDRWVSFRGQGECNNPDLNIDGRQTSSRGYVTDLLTSHAVSFLEQQNGPFCLYLSHKAIHPNIQQRNDGSIDLRAANSAEYFIPAERHRNLYAGMTPPRRGNYRKPPQGKPALQRALAGVEPLADSTITDDAAILARMRMLKAVDESTGSILAALERKGILDQTMVVFTSDHGYFYGEHCLGAERRLAYEETIRIPLLIRYPKHFRPGSQPKQMVLGMDVGATALALAGVPRPASMQARPLDARPHRDAILIEYFSDTVFARIRDMGYQAIRTNRWKYVHYTSLKDSDELYDLQKDPFELVNRIGDPTAPLPQLRAQLDALRKPAP